MAKTIQTMDQGITDHLGEMLVLELGKRDTPVVTGFFCSYDGDFLELSEYLQHGENCTLPRILRSKGELDPDTNPENDASKDYFLNRKFVNKSTVVSFQTFEDVMEQYTKK
jgi:hypothetical protein